MSITYPTTKDSLTNPSGTDTLSGVDHADQHSDVNDAIEALETKVGVDSSAVVTSLDYLIKSASSTNPGHKHPEAKVTVDISAGHDHDGTDSKLISVDDLDGSNLATDGFGVSDKVLLNFVPKTITDAGDYTTATEHDFTDWDLTALTSSTAVRVKLRVLFQDDTAGSYIAFRKNGDTGELAQTFYLYAITAGLTVSADIDVDMDAGQIIEIKTSDIAAGGPVTAVIVSVSGWYEPAQT